jgi:NAD(P)-dependent dehydrogenase (short-subunit alcohol dehydrogenase family)
VIRRSLAELADAALEVSVVGSFTNVGYAARRGLFAWPAVPPGALTGQTALVTGANSGIGLATARAFADLGARVILAGRSRDRLESVRLELLEEHADDRFPVVEVDMGSLGSVRRAVEEIQTTEARLDVIVDNAGAVFDSRAESPDQIEATLATMVVGPFALVSELLPLLRRSAVGSGRAPRVISVASGGMYLQPVEFDDLEWRTRPWDGLRAYAQAKRIQVAIMRERHRRERQGAQGRAAPPVRFSAMHPGWVDTPGVAASIPRFRRLLGPWLRSAAQGADTIVWLAADPAAGAAGGRLYLDRRARPFDRLPATRLDADARRRLWDLVFHLASPA